MDLFTYNSNFAGPRRRHGATGDAYVLLADAGAALVNMEFLEFTVIPTPHGRAIPVGGTKPTTAAGARWYNRLGERIMERYDPARLEMTTRNMMVLAHFLEREAGRGAVYMDLSFVTAEQYEKMVACAALSRTETRGQHHRRDYPDKYDHWQCWVKLQGDQVMTMPVPSD